MSLWSGGFLNAAGMATPFSFAPPPRHSYPPLIYLLSRSILSVPGSSVHHPTQYAFWD
jgi:hypothetical protein